MLISAVMNVQILFLLSMPGPTLAVQVRRVNKLVGSLLPILPALLLLWWPSSRRFDWRHLEEHCCHVQSLFVFQFHFPLFRMFISFHECIRHRSNSSQETTPVANNLWASNALTIDIHVTSSRSSFVQGQPATFISHHIRLTMNHSTIRSHLEHNKLLMTIAIVICAQTDCNVNCDLLDQTPVCLLIKVSLFYPSKPLLLHHV